MGSTCLLASLLLLPASAFAAPPDDPALVEAPSESEPAPTIDADELRRLQARLDALESEVELLRAEQAAAEQERTKQAEAASAATSALAEADEPAGTLPVGSVGDAQHPPDYASGFHFGSYGRVVGAGDLRGRPARNADLVAHGSRWDESTYAELELRREDYWKQTGAYTRIVATLAVAHPIFHYDTNFAAKIAVRNLYIEEQDLGAKGLSLWAGSRMYRGDDVYVLDWWPLDNLNTIGGGLGYQSKVGTFFKIHAGVMQPNDPFFRQLVGRSPALDQPGLASVAVLDRQKLVTSYKLGHVFKVGETGGIKLIGYGETHHVRAGQREQDYRQFQAVPADLGFVAGGELSLFTGKRSTHLNLWVRHAWNLAAYGDFSVPNQLAPDRTTKGARELVVALGGNWEYKFFGLMLGSYFRRFRNASPDLDVGDVNEGIVLVRPQFWFGKWAGTALEASYQFQQRGVLADLDADATPAPLYASMWRMGVMPFVSVAGRGAYARPHIRLMYMATLRDDGARALYPVDDVFHVRGVDHFFGLGAEWWFGSTSYFRD
ncbi:carbohydrate porin [Nannocystaceae bacterium ST9]